MRLIDQSFSTPQENISFDEALLKETQGNQGEEVLRFWESPTVFVVLGRISQEKKDLIEENLHKDHIPVIRRSSGGGSVLQGKGCLNYSLILSKAKRPEIHDLKKSYKYILHHVVEALAQLKVKAVFQPTPDVALVENNKKISGNAQKRGRDYILHHGTLLYQFDLGIMERYLHIPQDQPLYRQGRSHRDFVSNAPVSPAAFKSLFAEMWSAKP